MHHLHACMHACSCSESIKSPMILVVVFHLPDLGRSCLCIMLSQVVLVTSIIPPASGRASSHHRYLVVQLNPFYVRSNVLFIHTFVESIHGNDLIFIHYLNFVSYWIGVRAISGSFSLASTTPLRPPLTTYTNTTTPSSLIANQHQTQNEPQRHHVLSLDLYLPFQPRHRPRPHPPPPPDHLPPHPRLHPPRPVRHQVQHPPGSRRGRQRRRRGPPPLRRRHRRHGRVLHS